MAQRALHRKLVAVDIRNGLIKSVPQARMAPAQRDGHRIDAIALRFKGSYCAMKHQCTIS